MKNYSKITENKDILTKEYADSIYANKSSVPAAVTESTVSGWGFTKNIGTVTAVKQMALLFNRTLLVWQIQATWAEVQDLYNSLTLLL